MECIDILLRCLYRLCSFKSVQFWPYHGIHSIEIVRNVLIPNQCEIEPETNVFSILLKEALGWFSSIDLLSGKGSIFSPHFSFFYFDRCCCCCCCCCDVINIINIWVLSLN